MSAIFFRFHFRGQSSRLRSPALERLLAHAVARDSVADWRAEATRLLSAGRRELSGIAPARLALLPSAEKDAHGATSVFIAAPISAHASMTSVRLPVDGLLQLDAAELSAFVADFNGIFVGSGARMHVVPDGTCYCFFDVELHADTRDPADMLGQDVWAFRPQGHDSARLSRLATETEMWLYEHPLNRLRTAAGKPALTGFWLWGGGPPRAHLAPRPFDFFGDDVFFSGWQRERLDSGPAPNKLVQVDAVPGSEAFEAALQGELNRAARRLRRRQLDVVFLSAGERCVEVIKLPGFGSWRRKQPWWESFDAEN